MNSVTPPRQPEYYASLLNDDAVLILLFHGVVNSPREPRDSSVRNYIRKHIEKDYFRAVLTSLQAQGTVLSMDDVLECCELGHPAPKRSFAITFDDGFENNVSVALPILQELNLPATFYICSQFVDENFMSWIDRIEECVERTDKASLRFPWSDREHVFATLQEKIEIMKEIRTNLKSRPEINVDEFSAALHLQCGRTEEFQGSGPLDQKLTWQQVSALNETPGCIVGGHSHAHHILSFLSDAELQADLAKSFSLLEQKADVYSHHYAYPEGQAHHYNGRVIELLKESGILCCPSAIDGLSELPSDPFHLKRVMVV